MWELIKAWGHWYYSAQDFIFFCRVLFKIWALWGTQRGKYPMANFSSVVGSGWGQSPFQITKSHHGGDFLLSRPCLSHSLESCLNVHTCSCQWGLSLVELQFQIQMTQEEPLCYYWLSPESYGPGWDQALIWPSGFFFPVWTPVFITSLIPNCL